jgi:hypothetical protein
VDYQPIVHAAINLSFNNVANFVEELDMNVTDLIFVVKDIETEVNIILNIQANPSGFIMPGRVLGDTPERFVGY